MKAYSTPTLFMVARANELYLTTLDQVAKRFRDKGYRVLVQLFPPGTCEDDVAADLEEQAAEGKLKGGVLILDRFVQRSWHLDDHLLRALELERTPALDALLAERLLPIVGKKFGLRFDPDQDFGREIREKEPGKYLSLYGRCVTAVFKEVFACEPNLPHLDILAPRLVQHEPFITTLWRNPVWAGNIISRDEAMGVLNGDRYPERLLRTVADIFELPHKQPGELIHDWMVEAGYPENRVRVIDDIQTLDPDRYSPDRRGLVIMDRHLAQENAVTGRPALLEALLARDIPPDAAHDLLSRVRSQIVIQFPLENALLDLVSAKFFSESRGLTEEDVVNALYDALVKHVAKC